MKCLVECEIENIGYGVRECYFVMDDHAKMRSRACVPASACRMPDGSPIADDWPAMWGEDGRSKREPGLVEAEVSQPCLIEIAIGNHRAFVLPDAIRLRDSAGKPAYRLVVVGSLERPGGPR